eukprot:6877679-Karenia_brevis.AAC.1
MDSIQLKRRHRKQAKERKRKEVRSERRKREREQGVAIKRAAKNAGPGIGLRATAGNPSSDQCLENR